MRRLSRRQARTMPAYISMSILSARAESTFFGMLDHGRNAYAVHHEHATDYMP